MKIRRPVRDRIKRRIDSGKRLVVKGLAIHATVVIAGVLAGVVLLLIVTISVIR